MSAIVEGEIVIPVKFRLDKVANISEAIAVGEGQALELSGKIEKHVRENAPMWAHDLPVGWTYRIVKAEIE